jgi:putative transposase
MRKVTQFGKKSKRETPPMEQYAEVVATGSVDSRIELIQALIPLGLMAVEEMLQAEVTALAGQRYQRTGGKAGVRWGSQPGSVYLADQKLAVQVPRVRDLAAQAAVPLASYQRLQAPRAADEGLLRKGLCGLSQRRYEECAALTPEAFGVRASSVSRRYIQASARHLRELCERRLEGYDVVAIFLDGKRFAQEAMLIALGITLDGQKVILGFAQTGTENERACSGLLRDLLERGLRIEQGVLCVMDGGKGLRAAVRKVFGDQALVPRCQWHKRENVVAYLVPAQQRRFRNKLQIAYAEPTQTGAKTALERVRKELTLVNESAVRSLDEGLEETLTLHRLGLARELGTSFKTTNCLESINSQVAHRTRRVCRWRNSNQMQRWLACALLDLEPRLRKVKGYRYLPQLRRAIQIDLRMIDISGAKAA